MESQTGNRRVRAVLLATAAVVAFGSVAGPVLRSAHAESTAATPITAQIDPLHSYADIVERTKPAVVTVLTTVEEQAQPGMQGGPGQVPFDEFFRRFFDQNGRGQMQPMPMPNAPEQAPQVMRGLGSGFIISADGLIVTNNHVVDGAKTIRVTLDDGTEHDATLVGRDQKTDIAVLRIKADGPLPVLEWDPSAVLRVGDPVLAIGNPFGVGTTVTSGIVSARGRDIHNGPYDDFIQVDAAINHGNSGGPLLDASGRVVGVNAAIYSPNDGNVGVGFAIPSDQAKSIVAELINKGSIERGYLGVQIQPITPDVANALGLKGTQGALVASVEPDTPAAKAGIVTGDVILRVNADTVKDAKSLSLLVAGLTPGTDQSLAVVRGGKEMALNVTIAKQAADEVAAATPARSDGSATVPELGLSVAGITPDMRSQFGLPEALHGLLVTDVTPDGTAANAGLETGDVIVSVNMHAVATPDEVDAQLKTAKDDGRAAVLLQVERNGTSNFIGVPVKSS
jgi:serine protease Do